MTADQRLAQTLGDRHVPLRDQVLEELRDRIITGRYAPGERLTEERLAQDFGVSRNPVREALRTAEAEGFVRMQPRRGVLVARPDASTIRDLFAIRGRLEPLAARLAAERATAEDVTALHSLLDAARAATDRGELDRVAVLNSRLHQKVIDIGGNVWLSAITTSLYRHVQWVFTLTVSHRAPHSWTEHVRLVEAIAAHDPDTAEVLAAAHVEAAAVAAGRAREEDGTSPG
ncbi:GntR family transcriptional regulator [Pseudonocardia sp. GCM10023141]|uniref:GntR family transcriptional regulator n=1 Tax=Pseudonocardia sp. GCM10023141 TaxID=3252653 RepID=UPI00361B7E15